MAETLVWRSPGQSTQRNPQRPQGLLPRAMMARHRCGTAVKPPDVVSAASSPNEIEAQTLPNVVSILRFSRAFSLRRATFNGLGRCGRRRNEIPRRLSRCKSSIWSTHFPKPYPDGLVFGQKANSYMHLSDYMVTPARLSVPVQVEAMVEPHVQS